MLGAPASAYHLVLNNFVIMPDHEPVVLATLQLRQRVLRD